MCHSMQQATHVEDGLGQRALLALLVDRRQVGSGGIGHRGADIDAHDQVAVAEVGREAGGEGLLVVKRKCQSERLRAKGWEMQIHLLSSLLTIIDVNHSRGAYGVWLVDQVERRICVRREVTHLRPGMPLASA